MACHSHKVNIAQFSSILSPATNFMIQPIRVLSYNPIYRAKEDAANNLLSLLERLGILDHILVNDHGYVHRVTGLSAYLEDKSDQR